MTYLQAHQVKTKSVIPVVIKIRGGEYCTSPLYHELTLEQRTAVFIADNLYQAFRFNSKSLPWAAMQFYIHGITNNETESVALAKELVQLGLLRRVGGNDFGCMYAISEKGIALVAAVNHEDRQHA